MEVGVECLWGKCRSVCAESRSDSPRYYISSVRPSSSSRFASPPNRRTKSHSDGREAGEKPRRSEVLQAVRDRGAELLQVHLDHHPQQGLRRHQVPGRASRRRGGSEGAGGGQRHGELRGRRPFHRRQGDGRQHGDRRAAPGRPTQDRQACGNTGYHGEGGRQLVVQSDHPHSGSRHRDSDVPHVHHRQRVTSSSERCDVIQRRAAVLERTTGRCGPTASHSLSLI